MLAEGTIIVVFFFFGSHTVIVFNLHFLFRLHIYPQILVNGTCFNFAKMVFSHFSGANAQNNTALVPGKPVVSMPATSLNMGMDLWNASPAAGTAKMRGNQSGAPSAVGGDHWIQVQIFLSCFKLLFFLVHICTLIHVYIQVFGVISSFMYSCLNF